MARAAKLFGAAEAMRRTAGAVVYKYYLPDEERRAAAVAAARAALGPAYDDLFGAASLVDLHDAAALAVA
jgi:hypothetical protein